MSKFINKDLTKISYVYKILEKIFSEIKMKSTRKTKRVEFIDCFILDNENLKTPTATIYIDDNNHNTSYLKECKEDE